MREQMRVQLREQLGGQLKREVIIKHISDGKGLISQTTAQVTVQATA